MARPTFRFAPSPNGELHIGHALSALVGWRWARRVGGRFLLRIEDIDISRSREHFVDQIFEDLAWLGLDWEESVLRQSQRFDAYQAQARRLHDIGLLYPCFATRAEIAAAVASLDNHPTDPDGAPIYPGLHKQMDKDEADRRIAAGEAHAWRIDMDRAVPAALARAGRDHLAYTELASDTEGREVVARPERWGDAVIVRKDTPASYHLAVVTDDAHQGVTHVTRGQDIEPATDLHVLLQTLLDLPTPLYHHHALLTDTQGRKLSKRDGDIGIRELRVRGMSPTDVLAMIDGLECHGPANQLDK